MIAATTPGTTRHGARPATPLAAMRSPILLASGRVVDLAAPGLTGADVRALAAHAAATPAIPGTGWSRADEALLAAARVVEVGRRHVGIDARHLDAAAACASIIIAASPDPNQLIQAAILDRADLHRPRDLAEIKALAQTWTEARQIGVAHFARVLGWPPEATALIGTAPPPHPPLRAGRPAENTAKLAALLGAG